MNKSQISEVKRNEKTIESLAALVKACERYFAIREQQNIKQANKE
ncbi:MAG: hypothetical protein WCP79_11940 [Bacillota bacterium]